MSAYDVVIADPVGNVTALVLNQDVERNDYMYIANRLMGIGELGIEQVGFVKSPKIGGSLRLEMMGGEFCGNATRSFGLYIAFCKGAVDSEIIPVEISGCSDVLNVDTNVRKGYAKTTMPLPIGIDCIVIDNNYVYVIEFEGIVHVIAENVEVGNEIYEKIKKVLINKYDIDAFGIMFLNNDELKITPLVYVKETDSVVYEHSCGSGTIATAIYLTKDKDDGIYSYDICNPGGMIEAQVYKQDGKVVKATIGGKVILSQIKSIEL
nr:hypothetical protein [Sedimentibacter sp.]